MNIEKIASAIEADAGIELPGLKHSLAEMNAGKVGRKYSDAQRLVREVRIKYEFTQPKFARLISTSVGALRDWEQGRAEPTGPAIKLIGMINRHPDLIQEIEQMSA
ncbi:MULTISPECIES: helix-turn-helix domain-containing protein [unclassified Methylophaga]|jgi:putative transcriptional regulator|uniref:helix-turn-helix domain-containing protein n=1 Tax=unclassified Methylophaga TaxID=2629249 RepID=UPI00259D1125|nr:MULTISPECIES: type II toxin-antitoxin system MqsA family antitoxin [unclassified Methylophaga]|tara:strand:- start:35712 stop:36029 length:318 start_codon:yes stop_codon:yes gene_type:complete